MEKFGRFCRKQITGSGGILGQPVGSILINRANEKGGRDNITVVLIYRDKEE